MSLTKIVLWYLGNIWDYFLQMLPCMGVALFIFVLLQPWRHKLLFRQGLSSSLWREVGLLLFTMFSAGLAALTLFPANFWTVGYWSEFLTGNRPLFQPVDFDIQLQTIQIEPFREIFRAFRGPWVMFLMLANIGIFSPIGFLVALLWRRPHWWKSMLIGFFVSLFIEFIQFFIGRSTDVDDVILNTTGALVGYWIFCLLKAIFPNFILKFQCQSRGGHYYR